MPHDLSPHGQEGRLTVGWADGIVKGGIMLVSVYLWHTEGLTESNRVILEAAGEAITNFGGAWLLGGDFNMAAEDLQWGMHAWLKKFGGKIFASAAPTCDSQSGGRTIDFMVLDTRIEVCTGDC